MPNNKYSFEQDVADKACRCYISRQALLAAMERQRRLADTVAISEVISEMVIFAYHELKKRQEPVSDITSHVASSPAGESS